MNPRKLDLLGPHNLNIEIKAHLDDQLKYCLGWWMGELLKGGPSSVKGEITHQISNPDKEIDFEFYKGLRDSLDGKALPCSNGDNK